MKLESIATMPLEIDIVFSKNPGKTVVMTTPLFEFLMNNKRCSKGRLAATVHMYLAKGLFEIAQKISIEKGLPIVFSGGVAYNKMISGFMRQQGVFVNRELPAGDGGICYGQAYLANLEKDPWCFF